MAIQEHSDRKDPDVAEELLYAPTRDGEQLPLRVFRSPHAKQDARPLIVLFFGGGFVFGSPVMMAKLSRALVKRFDAVVVAPKYRLAPEHPFPTGLNDGWDVLTWIAAHSSNNLKADPSKGFVVGGISAGGNITNIISHLARDAELQPPITGCWLSVAGPRVAPKDAEKLPQKYRERLLSSTQEEALNSLTLPPGMRALIDRSFKRDVNSHIASPLIWPTPLGKDYGEFGHKGMPKTYSQVCGADAMRDELLVYDDMLKNEGIPTRVDLYPGLPHAFWHPLKQLPESKQWEQKTLEGFAWLLETS